MRYQPDAGPSARAAARSKAGARLKRRLRGFPEWELLRVRGGASSAAAGRLRREAAVDAVTPNPLYRLAAVPNDTYFDQVQWNLHSAIDADIDAPSAWGRTTGSSAVTVAVVDTGVSYDHPDLAPNMWTNAGESGDGKESNGIDDDANGYVDDALGYDFANSDANPDDDNGHGTHVAGVIGARGNDGYGVAGVAWSVRMMALRVFGADGTGSMADIAEAFEYAADNGAAIVNASLEGDPHPLLASSISGNGSTLFVVAAGNADAGYNVDSTPAYPCSYSYANILCVAATKDDDTLASFSNYGRTAVDLAAPGQSIPSTYLPSLAAYSGTKSLSDSPEGAYANGTSTWAALASPLDLTGKSGCRLDYRLRYDTLAGDQVVAERSTDGIAWAVIDGPASGYSTSTTRGFDPRGGGLQADGAPTAWIRFRLTSDSAGTHDGISIDQVVVSCTSGGVVFSEGFESGFANWATGGTHDTWGTTSVAGEWVYMSGTSMATPHVSGVAALAWAARPSSSVKHVRNVILGSVDRKGALDGKVATGGRLNAARALSYVDDVTAPAGPSITGTAIGARFQRSKSLGIGWNASDTQSGVRSYDIRFRRARYTSGFGGFATWKSGTSRTSGTFTGSPGYTYCLDARARDRALNLSGWGSDRCTSFPVNDRSLSRSSGWSDRTGSGYYLGSYRYTTRKGAKLKLYDVELKRLALVATTCDGCGTVDVYRGGTRLARISLHSSSYRKARVIPVKTYSSVVGPSTITIVVRSSGRRVRIEGLGVSRV